MWIAKCKIVYYIFDGYTWFLVLEKIWFTVFKYLFNNEYLQVYNADNL